MDFVYPSINMDLTDSSFSTRTHGTTHMSQPTTVIFLPPGKPKRYPRINQKWYRRQQRHQKAQPLIFFSHPLDPLPPPIV